MSIKNPTLKTVFSLSPLIILVIGCSIFMIAGQYWVGQQHRSPYIKKVEVGSTFKGGVGTHLKGISSELKLTADMPVVADISIYSDRPFTGNSITAEFFQNRGPEGQSYRLFLENIELTQLPFIIQISAEAPLFEPWLFLDVEENSSTVTIESLPGAYP